VRSRHRRREGLLRAPVAAGVQCPPDGQINLKFEIDLVNTVGTQQNYLQMRELYGDIFLDKGKNAWVRVGLAKVPYGYENLQSSSVRLSFDRDDALNSGVPGERDLGVFFVWGTSRAHRVLRRMTDSSFKGEGDYGILSAGIYNGQAANRAEANDNKHVAARLSYPFLLPANQILSLGAQGYVGTYTLTSDLRTPGVAAPEGYDFDDRRVALSAVLVPRPLGLQAEWNWGDGPRYDPARNATVNGTVDGGYVQATYRIALPEGRMLFPYCPLSALRGGQEERARRALLRSRRAGGGCGVPGDPGGRAHRPPTCMATAASKTEPIRTTFTRPISSGCSCS
jgi:hypothetical protein